MCGLAGYFDTASQRVAGDMHERVARMAATLVHRGPDDQGTWVDPEVGIALGSRRLAIIDVSPDGHQPMVSASGRYVIAYNGEVYNARDIARTLESTNDAPRWRGHSDTEVILAAIDAWGFAHALERFNGMFAYALWDRRERQLHLVRDRLGIKPLYVGHARNTLVFGSELRALMAHPEFDPSLDREWLDHYLRGTRMPTNRTPYEGVRCVRPGTYLTYHAEHEPEERVYWSAVEAADKGHRERFAGNDTEATQALHVLLRDAVKIRRVSDVPLGVLLSGGIDSATVLALLAENDSTVRSFSIGFPEPGLDEAPDARAIAAHIGSDHTELYITPNDVIDLIPSLPRLSDVPIADPSYVSNYFAYRLAGEHVTVALTGDGGDEVFGGYHRHRWLPRVWRTMGWIPPGMRARVARALDAVSPTRWDAVFAALEPVIPGRLRERTPGAKIQRLARWMACDTPEEMYGVLASRWGNEDDLVVGHHRPTATEPVRLQPFEGDFEFVERMLVHELVTYLPDVQLTKVDRASMSVSVEARVPILDYRVVEFALRLPPRLKIRGELGKYILRQVLHQHVPEALFQRPKMGFQLPLSRWLRGPLREWAEDLLQPDLLRREGLLQPDAVRAIWDDHMTGRRDRSDHLWTVLMFQSWLEAQ